MSTFVGYLIPCWRTVIILIIIKSRWLHEFPCLSLSTCLNHPSLTAGLPNCIQCSHSAYISLCWSANTGMSMCRGPWENVNHEFVLVSPAVLHMSCLSYLEGFRDGRYVAIQLLFHGMLLPGFVKIKDSILLWFQSVFFFRYFSKTQVVQPYSSSETATLVKNFRFILSEGSDLHMVANLSMSLSVDGWLVVVFVLQRIKPFRSFKAELSNFDKTVLFRTIQFSMSTQFFVYIVKWKRFPFQTIQFSVITV